MHRLYCFAAGEQELASELGLHHALYPSGSWGRRSFAPAHFAQGPVVLWTLVAMPLEQASEGTV